MVHLNQIFRYFCEVENKKIFVDDILLTWFILFIKQSVFSNFEHYLAIINLLYLNQEPVDFDKTFSLKYKIIKEKKLKSFCLFYMISFTVKELIFVYKFWWNIWSCQYFIKSGNVFFFNSQYFAFKSKIEARFWNFNFENEILLYMYLAKNSWYNKVHLVEKIPYEFEKKTLQQNYFIFQFNIEFWKFCQNWPHFDWDITNLWNSHWYIQNSPLVTDRDTRFWRKCMFHFI